MRRVFKEYPNYAADSRGFLVRIKRGRGTWVGRIVRGAKRSDGYLQVFGFGRFYAIHQIITHVFLGPCPPGKLPNHKDNIRGNNRLSNLEYLTRAENYAHGYTCGNVTLKKEERRIRSTANSRKIWRRTPL